MGKMIRIQTKTRSKSDFRRAFLAKVKPGSKITEKTAMVFTLDAFFNMDRDLFYGEIDEYSFWIIRPHRMWSSSSQRIFRGDYSEENGSVVAVGSFEFSDFDASWNILFGAVVAFFAFLGFLAAQIPAALFLALGVGAAACGLVIGARLLMSRLCEKDVVKFLSSIR